MGREILQIFEEFTAITGEIGYVHTSEDDEHQIAELGGQPALVPPLTGPDELANCAGIIVASDVDRPRLEHVLSFVRSDDSALVIDASRTTRLRADTRPAAGAADAATERHLHIAHPAIVSTAILVRALHDLEPTSGTVAAVDPVSSLADSAIESLARQAAQRLSGAQVEELIANHVLAFTLIAVDDHDLNEDAAVLLPSIDLSVSRSLAGRFHGHVAHIGLRFTHPVEDPELLETLMTDPRITLCDTPITLDSIAESNGIAINPPRLSRDRRGLSVTAMMDGLRIGGAVTALEILRARVETTH